MTAYGRASSVSSLGRFVVEIVSVNRKHLEVKLNLPQELLRFEPDVRRWVAQSVSRGMVTVHVRAVYEETCPSTIRPNIAMARQLKEAWDSLAQATGIQNEQAFSLELLKDVRGLFSVEETFEDEDAYRQALESVIAGALDELDQMKCLEGQSLREEFLNRLDQIDALAKQVREKAPVFVERFRAKILARVEELVKDTVDHEERMLREVALYAEKVDIMEELDRVDSHLAQFRAGVQGKGLGGGKRLDFLSQELYREANTMGAKAADPHIVSIVVDMKTVIERMREQLQNVE